MTQSRYVLRRIMVALAVLMVLGGSSWFLFFYLNTLFLKQSLSSFDEGLFIETLLQVLVVGGMLLSILIALLVYLFLSIQHRARIMASHLTADLSLSKEQFQVLYDDGPVPYLVLAHNGVVERPNKAALRLFEHTAPELEGKPFFETLIIDDESSLRIQLAEAFERKIPVHNKEVQINTGSETPRFALISIFPVGTKEHVALVTLVDITERREMDRIKTEFVSLAAHQLRAPLSAIKWYSEMLAKTALDQKQGEYLKGVQMGNEQMIDLARKLLEVSRIEMGSVAVRLEKTDVVKLTDNVIKAFQPQIIKAELSVHEKYDSSLEAVVTDPRLLTIILQNLLSNAIKYTEEKGVISVFIREVQGGIQIEVRDTGCGIPPEAENRIFTKLFRAENVRGHKGMGLGLYMSKSLVTALGGTISFTSTVDSGTTFTVNLPFVAPEKSHAHKN